MQAARSALRRLATSHMPEKTGKHVRQMSGGAVSHEEVRGTCAWNFLHLARKGSVGRLPSVCYFLGLVQATDEYTDSRQEVKQMNLWRNCTIAGRAQALLSIPWHSSYPVCRAVRYNIENMRPGHIEDLRPSYSALRPDSSELTHHVGMQLFLCA